MLYFLIVESLVGKTLFPSLTNYLVPVNLFIVDVKVERISVYIVT